MRRVLLLCGPPGAGKTTHARATGLDVYDRDDARWDAGGERAFRQAIARLRTNPTAQAVVIRSGPTIQARARTAATIGATEVQVIAPPLDVCIERITARHRLKQPIKTQIASARSWWHRYEPPGDQGMSPTVTSLTVTPMSSRWVL